MHFVNKLPCHNKYQLFEALDRRGSAAASRSRVDGGWLGAASRSYWRVVGALDNVRMGLEQPNVDYTSISGMLALTISSGTVVAACGLCTPLQAQLLLTKTQRIEVLSSFHIQLSCILSTDYSYLKFWHTPIPWPT